MESKDAHVIILAAGCSRRLAELTKEKPKSFLEVNGKRVIDYTLDTLNDRGFKQVTLVVGYLDKVFRNNIGNKYKNLEIEYVFVKEYEEQGHGWSIFSTKSIWEQSKKPVVLVHADVFFDPLILDKVLASQHKNVLGVDNHYEVLTNDEVVAVGNENVAKGIKKGIGKREEAAGEIIGINKWSPEFMEKLYNYMEQLFAKDKETYYNWEPVVDQFINEEGIGLNYEVSDGLAWININYKEDYDRARTEIYEKIYTKSTTE